MTRPILLIPGMLCDARLWSAQISFLEAAGYPVIIPDIACAEDIDAVANTLLAAAPERFILGGLSMGGYVALAMLRRLHEQNALHRVEKLLLIATSARADMPEQSRVRRGLLQLARMGKFKGVTPKLLPSLIHPSRVADTTITDVIFAMADTIGLDGFIRQETAVMNRPDQSEILPHLPMPTLILCGDTDQRTPPECSQDMARLIPNSQFHLLTDCGHLPPMERPELTARHMLEFLA